MKKFLYIEGYLGQQFQDILVSIFYKKYTSDALMWAYTVNRSNDPPDGSHLLHGVRFNGCFSYAEDYAAYMEAWLDQAFMQEAVIPYLDEE